MLEFLKEMVKYYCWEGYSIWEFLSVIVVEILIIAWVITNVILVFKHDDNKNEEPEPEPETENDFIFDISSYEDFDIYTPLSQQEKP